MGIRHLDSFVRDQQSVPNGVFTVDILKEISLYKRNHPGKKPLIVVDQLGFFGFWQPKEHVLCGFRAKQYLNSALKFFNRLKEAGVEFAFFDDGPAQKEKAITWFKRRNGTYKETLKVIDEIIAGTSVSTIIKSNGRQIDRSPIVTPLFKAAIKEVGGYRTEVLDVECDLALAAYATEHEALAIFANDTDFLIYPGQWHYWSIQDLDMKQMKTLEFDKKAVRRVLRLTELQMPLFATLGGNDIVKYDDVVDFHRSFRKGKKFHNIAECIEDFPIANYTEHDIQTLCKYVFGPSWNKFVEKVKSSLASYSYQHLKTIRSSIKESDPLLEKLREHDVLTHYSILKGYPNNITLLYHDMRDYETDTKAKSFTAMTLDIFRRKIGMTLQHKDDESITRSFNLKESHGEGYKNIKATGIYPDFTVPPLEPLIFRKEDDGLDEMRFKLFAWLLKDSFDEQKLFRLDNAFIPLLATLSYLIQESNFTVDDADVFVCAYYDCHLGREPENIRCPEKLNPNAFKQVFMVLKVCHQVTKCLSAVGLAERKVTSVFDGFHYHHLQQKWSKLGAETKERMLEEIKDLREIYCNC